MKKIFVAIVCMVIFSITGFAQRNNQRSPEEMAKLTTERMKTELKLTEAQVTPVDSINLVFAKAQAKLREKANGDFTSIREDMQKLEALRVEAYAKVLTKEQLEAYKKMAAERMRNREGGGGRRGDRPNN